MPICILLFSLNKGDIRMDEQVSFTKRMVDTYNIYASSYCETFVNKSYLMFSEKFTGQEYYILEAKAENFLHLTGAKTNLKPKAFWEKCINNKLEESDIIPPQNKDEKGTLRAKLFALENIDKLFKSNTFEIEENFSRNRITCKIAAANAKITLGYVGNHKLYPMSLMKKNMLNAKNKIKVDLLLRKELQEDLYSTVVYGDLSSIEKSESLKKLSKFD